MTDLKPGTKLIGRFGATPYRPPPRVVTVEKITPTGRIKLVDIFAMFYPLDDARDYERGHLIGSPKDDLTPYYVALPGPDDDLTAITATFEQWQEQEATRLRRHQQVRVISNQADRLSRRIYSLSGGLRSQRAKDWPFTDEELDTLTRTLDDALRVLNGEE